MSLTHSDTTRMREVQNKMNKITNISKIKDSSSSKFSPEGNSSSKPICTTPCFVSHKIKNDSKVRFMMQG